MNKNFQPLNTRFCGTEFPKTVWKYCTSVIKENIQGGAQRVGFTIQLLQPVTLWGPVLLELRQLETRAEVPTGGTVYTAGSVGAGL